MVNFVKPNSIVRDARGDAEKQQALYDRTQRNLHHINNQLQAHGQSIETLTAHAAKTLLGISIDPHAPEPKDAA